MKSILLSAGTLLLITACQNEALDVKSASTVIVETSQWLNPINDLRIAPDSFTFSTEKDKIIALETGSKLFIPAYSFVDKEGNPIQGEVKLNFNEYHSFGEVMLSGLPMKYDSAGVEKDMITGGMFRIEAYQQGEKLFLANDKKIKVAINSNTGVESMNFYQLNENTGDWTYKQAGTGVKEKRNSLQLTPALERNNSEYTLLDIKININNLKIKNSNEIVAWKTKNKLSSEEKKRLKFSNVGTEIFETDKQNEYRLVIYNPTKIQIEKFELIIEPYLVSEAIEDSKTAEAKFLEDTKEVNDYLEKLEKNEIVRSIEISSMGTYNWDYLYHRAFAKQLECHLNFPRNTNSNFATVFTICPDDNAIVRLNFSDKGHYVYDPTKRNCIVAITKDNRVYFVPNSAFESQNQESTCLNFNLQKSDLVLTSPSDFDKQLYRFI